MIDGDYEPDEADMSLGDEDEGTCPACGSRLRYVELIPEADVGVNRCEECGWEGGVG
jgi:transcription initiation factor IIE alpha subunit